MAPVAATQNEPNASVMAEMDDQNPDGDDAIQSLIGRQLRSLYDSVLNEPIPDSIVSLLLQLDDVPIPRIDADQDDRNDPGTDNQ